MLADNGEQVTMPDVQQSCLGLQPLELVPHLN